MGLAPMHMVLSGNRRKIYHSHRAGVVRTLAKMNADLEARHPTDGRTPLHMAAALHDMETVKTLLELGVDRYAKDDEGKVPAQVTKLKEIGELLRV